jgi:hypothetical protein
VRIGEASANEPPWYASKCIQSGSPFYPSLAAHKLFPEE